ncbi:hypothetical protein [Nocardioides sp.]|uniref:Uncharacterized protein n=1 Tax=metagenome TaxID=256318 RepID=A0A2P2BX91_9ZZZZ
MTVVLPDHDDAAHPEDPARIVSVQPNLPFDWHQGDMIVLSLDLDRPFGVYELREVDNRMRNWRVFTGSTRAEVEMQQVDDNTLTKLQKILTRLHEEATRHCEEAEQSRKLLDRIIDGWDL